jgi:lipoprotein-anchoring transpeptidase ErfK/SrfK
MPYAMYFDGSIAFHTSTRYIYDSLGSHGCVHILPNKAAWLWSQMPLSTKVYVFGRKPGT